MIIKYIQQLRLYGFILWKIRPLKPYWNHIWDSKPHPVFLFFSPSPRSSTQQQQGCLLFIGVRLVFLTSLALRAAMGALMACLHPVLCIISANTKGPCYRKSHNKVLNKVTNICSELSQLCKLLISKWKSKRDEREEQEYRENNNKKRSKFCLILHLHLAAVSQTPIHEISPAGNQWQSEACKGQPFSRLALVDQSSTGL